MWLRSLHVAALIATTEAGAAAASTQDAGFKVLQYGEPESIESIALDTLWTVGADENAGPDSLFTWISALGVDSVGRILVLDGREAILRTFDRRGTFLRAVGGSGEGPGEFRLPTALAVAPDGAIVVYDRGLGRFTEFGPNLEVLRTLRPEFVVSGYTMLVDDSLIYFAGVVRRGPYSRRAIHAFSRGTGRHVFSTGRIPEARSEVIAQQIGAGSISRARNGGFWHTYAAPYVFVRYSPVREIETRVVRETRYLPSAEHAYDVVVVDGRAQISTRNYASASAVRELPDGRILHQTFLTDGRRLYDWYAADLSPIGTQIGKAPALRDPLGDGAFLVRGGGVEVGEWFGAVRLRNPPHN